MRAWLFLVSLPLLAALDETYTEWATKLRADLKVNYDFVVPPRTADPSRSFWFQCVPRSVRLVNYSSLALGCRRALD